MVPTCIGCGAMSRPGACELGCGEERKLELVDAHVCDELEEAAAAARARCIALRAVTRRLAEDEPADWEAAYHSVQAEARVALREHPAPQAAPDEPAHVATTWWCPRCGGIDAPQPCIGVCVWRPVEWVRAERYAAARTRADTARESERRLRSVLRTVATVTPRAGQWEQSWRALEGQARDIAVP